MVSRHYYTAGMFVVIMFGAKYNMNVLVKKYGELVYCVIINTNSLFG